MKYPQDFINKIICGDCLEVMKDIPDNSVDLVVTSPPYDNLREYNGNYNFDFDGIVKELLRVVKNGGVVVWVVGDSVNNGSETGTSFRQALFFKELGFNLHDTMIYQKDTIPFPEVNRYEQGFEFMFVFSKNKPKTFNPIKVKTKGYKPSKSSTTRQEDGTTARLKYEQGKPFRKRFNVWSYGVGYLKSTQDKIAFNHPAIFPDNLAQDHIISWSNKNDLILDPFLGSGTTAVVCKKLNRKFIGIEINPEYCKIAEERLKKIPKRLDKFVKVPVGVN